MVESESKKDFLTLKDFTKQELDRILQKAFELKYKINKSDYKPFKDKTLAMIFEKPSTRTRVSFEVGVYELGGHSIYLNNNDTQLGKGETIEDTARTLSEYVDMIMIRTFEHEKVEKLAEASKVPVINGLTDLYHPCQVLSDIWTIIEKKGNDLSNLNLLYIGDGMNVANSLIDASDIFGFNLYVATPKGYEPKFKTNLVDLKNIGEIMKKADVVYTDVWTSMGRESEEAKRLQDFKDYQLNSQLMKKAKNDVLIMHCLPAHRGEEISDEIMDSKNSIVFEQAGNRLHVQKAIMLYCMDEILVK